MSIPRCNVPEILGCIKIAAAFWPDKDAEFFRLWAAPLIESCHGGITDAELAGAIEAARSTPVIVYAVPEISDVELARREDAERSAVRASRQETAERAVMRDSSPRYTGGGFIDLDAAERRQRNQAR
jgi:hypothetical protein